MGRAAPLRALGARILISGCSGGGKSTLLESLRQRGERVIEEPGRRIVSEELAGDGASLPWIDPAAFARQAFSLSLQDLHAVEAVGVRIFFDRGLIDAAVAIEHATGQPAEALLAGHMPFNRRIFLAPPWPEIYETDDQRTHSFEEAVAEYERLAAAFPRLGYEAILIPKASVEARTDFILATSPDRSWSRAAHRAGMRPTKRAERQAVDRRWLYA